MKKVVFKNSRGKKLVGDFYKADSDKCIILCHGFTGDRHEWGRMDKTAQSLNKANYNILNFDFSGSGESDDDSITVKKEIDDLKSAIKFVKEKEFSNIGLLGLSLGGLVSLKNYTKKIKAMVLWAPVTSKKENYAQKQFNESEIKELEEKGFITKMMKEGIRKKIIIDKKIIEEREAINQKELLSKVKVPVLIIHGDKDESVPLEDSKNATQYLPEDSKLEIIEEADHGFSEQLDELIELSLNWFKKYL